MNADSMQMREAKIINLNDSFQSNHMPKLTPKPNVVKTPAAFKNRKNQFKELLIFNG